MNAKWADVFGFEGMYKISANGIVINKETGDSLKIETGHEYPKVKLPLKRYPLHRILMESFFPIPNMRAMQVDHVDGDKMNYDLSNLEWVTHGENQKRAATMRRKYKENKNVCKQY